MEMMNDLLEKYFRGETSLAEEKKLKQYFLSGNVDPEHELYSALFVVFEQELNVRANSPFKEVVPKQHKIKKIWYQTFAYTGIAATIVILLWVRLPKETDNYAVIGGARIENTEYVQRYTVGKLTKVTHILARTMKPMNSFNEVRKSMVPIKNISDVRTKMDDIKNKLQFK